MPNKHKPYRRKLGYATTEYKELMSILGKVNLEVVPGSGIGLHLVMEQVIEDEVRARMGRRYKVYHLDRKWRDKKARLLDPLEPTGAVDEPKEGGGDIYSV